MPGGGGGGLGGGINGGGGGGAGEKTSPFTELAMLSGPKATACHVSKGIATSREQASKASPTASPRLVKGSFRAGRRKRPRRSPRVLSGTSCLSVTTPLARFCRAGRLVHGAEGPKALSGSLSLPWPGVCTRLYFERATRPGRVDRGISGHRADNFGTHTQKKGN